MTLIADLAFAYPYEPIEGEGTFAIVPYVSDYSKDALGEISPFDTCPALNYDPTGLTKHRRKET